MLASWILVLASPAALQAAPQLTLDQAIAEAEAQAPAIESAEADRDAAAARTTQARAAGRPSATLTGTIGRGRLDPGGFFGLQAADVTPRAAQATFEQPLFTGGRVGAATARALAGERMAEAAGGRVRADLAARVAQAYGAVLVEQERQRLYAALVMTTTELVRHATDRFDVGDAPRTDLNQAKVRQADARAQLANAQGAILVARARLANLVGRDPGTLAPLPAPPAVPGDLSAAILRAEQASPTIAQAQAGLDAALAAKRGAGAERLPTVGAFAEAATVRDQFFPGYRGDSATIGLRARWQFLDGGRVRGQLAEADAGVRAARAALAAARDQTQEAVIAAHAAVTTSALIEQAAGDQRAAAEEAVRNVRDEVKVGQKPQIDLLDAEREATAAGVLVLSARADRVTAAYQLNALLGGH
ncbi:TolC family protein [Sphingomonas sp. S1-29]|uniref:TolC family protein n=1 Tax=Sphingomonas sp. S1-29 TaxID=2991074 RepID=UPI00223FF4D7|nr:TolC family protein [Sphingomonas sp. S1-29]UZK70588.1 TolC family protein [Sphingomonas sp. S1-29]